MLIDKFTFNKITKDFPKTIEEFIDAKIEANNSDNPDDSIRLIKAREKLESTLSAIAVRL